MPIYQTTRYLLDSVNSLDLPRGSYVKTDCQSWVKRFGDDLRLVDGDPITAGYPVKILLNLKEEKINLVPPLSPTMEPEVVTNPVPVVELPQKMTATVVRRPIRVSKKVESGSE